MYNTIIPLPERTMKPRESGLTMVIDSGRGATQIRDALIQGGSYVDYVKLGWATALVTQNLSDKIEVYNDLDIPVCLGGTLFELAYIHNRLDEYTAFAKDHGIHMIEISDGTIDMEQTEKLSCIENMAKHFKVLSEYGSKDAEAIAAPYRWVEGMTSELKAGAWKVIGEGRESGTAGMYRGNEELRMGLVDELVHVIDVESIIWEAPKKPQQSWFIDKFGQNVNLGNIAMDDIIALETLRLGIRSDTLAKFHQPSS